MSQRFPLLSLATLLLAVACSTTKPTPTQPVAEVDPATDPSVIGAVATAVDDGARAAETGRRIGVAAGIFAAVFGGPEVESIDDAIARYRAVRDTGEAIGAVVGATQGAKRGFKFDVVMAELEKFDDLDVTRPAPDEILVRFDDPNTPHMADVARIVNGRVLMLESADDSAIGVRDALIENGVPASTLQSYRNDRVSGVVLHVFIGGN